MFDMGLWEILLIGVIALIVVGPERLPRLARTAGLWLGKARSMVATIRYEVEHELKVNELKREIKQQTDSEEFRDLSEQVKSVDSDLRSVGKALHTDIDGAPESTDTPPSKTEANAPSSPDSPSKPHSG